MKILTYISIALVLIGVGESVANEPVGPAYAAQKAAELKELQRTTPTSPPATGPVYAIARQRWLYNVQRQNTKYWGATLVGSSYSAYNLRAKANQRLWNGTWSNNVHWFSNPTIRIKNSYLSTPAFRNLNDPYIWGSQANSFWRY